MDDPSAAKAAWLGEFRDDIGGWADEAVIEAAVDVGVTVRPPSAGISCASFCDPSGGACDSFTAEAVERADAVCSRAATE